jgi:hypothetical protein
MSANNNAVPPQFQYLPLKFCLGAGPSAALGRSRLFLQIYVLYGFISYRDDFIRQCHSCVAVPCPVTRPTCDYLPASGAPRGYPNIPARFRQQ